MPSTTSNDVAFSFLQGAPLAILAVDSSGKIAFANLQSNQLFGFAEQELLGQPIEMLIPKAYQQRHPELVRSFLQDPHARVMGTGRELRAVDRNGREFPVEIGLTPITTNAGLYVVAAIADITARKHLEREVTAAKLVQEAMLPQHYPQTPGCEIAGATRFAEAAGGDFLDCIVSREDGVTLMIGDASGHGFASALVSVAAKAYLRAISRQCHDLGELLTRVNRLLVEDLAEGRFVTLFVGRLLTTDGRFRYAGGGHAGYILSPHCELKAQLNSTGPPLGWLPDATYTVGEAAVEPGDYILLMTDGIEESFSEDDKTFGRERIFRTIAELSNRTVAEQAQGILDAVHRFTNSRQTDDRTVLLTKVG